MKPTLEPHDNVRVSNRAQLILLVTTAFLVLLLCFAALPTVVQWSIGGYVPRQLFSSTSPDGRYRVDGVVRVDFPANEMLDPSGTLSITLWDSRSGKPLDSLSLGFYERDYVKKPTIAWEADGRVQVLDMEEHGHLLSATLNPDAWKPR